MVIYLNNPYEQQRKLYEQGLLNMAMRQFQANMEKKMLEWKLQKEQEMWEQRQKKQMEMEDERSRKYIKDLLGEQKTEISNINDILRVGDIQNDLVNSLPQNPVSRAVNSALGTPQKQSGFLGKRSGDFFDQARENFLVNSPAPPSPKLTTRYEGGALSGLVNQNPQLANQIKAQVYGVRLPKAEKKMPKVVGHGKVDVGDGIVPYAIIQGADGRIKFEFDKKLYKSLTPEQRLKFREKLKKEKENIAKTIKSNNQQAIIVRPDQLIRQIKKSAKRTRTDMLGNQIAEEVPVTFSDVKKFFAGKEIYIKGNGGKTYKVAGVIDNYPAIQVGNELFKIVGERDGEPIVSAEIDGQVISVPASKIEGFKQKYKDRFKGNKISMSTGEIRTSEEYLQKWKIR